MKLNQEWEKEWESIDVPKAELFQIIDEQIGKQTTKKKIKISNFLSQLGKYPAAIAVVGIVIFSLILIIFYQGGPIGQNAGQFSKEEASQQVADSQIPAPAAAKNESAVNDSAVNLPEEKEQKNAQFYTMTKKEPKKLDLANDKLKKIVQKKFDGYIEKNRLFKKPEKWFLGATIKLLQVKDT
ncbi:hypothetical protein [Enterococcus rivorum]|uniref:hypothetical protein n=1 Tax=Enterococcus rivorum TaxID=762845 RepID=UPI0036429E13